MLHIKVQASAFPRGPAKAISEVTAMKNRHQGSSSSRAHSVDHVKRSRAVSTGPRSADLPTSWAIDIMRLPKSRWASIG